MEIRINGENFSVENGLSVYEAAKAAGVSVPREVIAAEINGETHELSYPVHDGDDVKLLTFEDEGGKKTFFHTASHILAQAVKRLYPEVKLTIGPAIDNGFYYDFDSDVTFAAEELEKIEAEMKKIVKENLKIERFTLPREEAKKLMEEKGEPYKVLLIDRVPEGEEISFYKQGEFTDLCAGPHLFSTGAIKAFKLTQCTGAYWEGDSKNKMLQRVYGTAFPTKEALAAYLDMLEEAKKRDHRKLGKELGLFTIMDEVHKRYGYVEISTPMILNRSLWERSGHWAHYKNNMYTTVIDGADFAIKPMNCPGGMLVYKSEMHSYRDLPLRMGELGVVHRHELSGALHGLFRVRCFTQDDAHIFMTWDQMKDEIKNVVRLFDEVYSVFGLSYQIEVSTMPEDHMGDIKDWDFATETLKEAVSEMGKDYVINEGDGAFYGPKLDFHLSDCLGRTWQCGTIQLDMQLPERFELEYMGADNEKHRPVMIHRVVLGSIERFIGIITEHYAGAFPLWLAPVQVKILPIGEGHIEYANKVKDILEENHLRVEVDARNEKIGYKIREAQLKKVPYMLVVGDKEMAEGLVAVRSRSEGELGQLTIEDFTKRAVEEVKSKVNK